MATLTDTTLAVDIISRHSHASVTDYLARARWETSSRLITSLMNEQLLAYEVMPNWCSNGKGLLLRSVDANFNASNGPAAWISLCPGSLLSTSKFLAGTMLVHPEDVIPPILLVTRDQSGAQQLIHETRPDVVLEYLRPLLNLSMAEDIDDQLFEQISTELRNSAENQCE